MRRAGLAMWVAATFAISGCAMHPPGFQFDEAHRRVLMQAATPARGLTLQWFGGTTLLFRDGDDAILIDAFLSRPSSLLTPFGALGTQSNCVISGYWEEAVRKRGAR